MHRLSMQPPIKEYSVMSKPCIGRGSLEGLLLETLAAHIAAVLIA